MASTPSEVPETACVADAAVAGRASVASNEIVARRSVSELMILLVTPSVTSAEGGVAINIPVDQLASIASSLPVGDLGLTPTELEKTLTTLPGLTGLNGVQETLLQTLLGALRSVRPLTTCSKVC